MNFLVETKNEYTIQLVNILSPHIFEGFESIYLESRKIIKKGEENKILKAFQQFIKRIPQWNNNLIETETKRIAASSRCDFLDNLLKAVIKSNIILLTNNNIKNEDIDKKFLDIPLSKFIHKCYIECARQFYTSPYLFFHDVKPIDKKRNQRDCNDLIKSSIKEAIRKMLPVQHILSKYLGSEIITGNVEIDKPLSQIDSENLKQLVNKELIKNSNFIPKSSSNKHDSSLTIKHDISYEETEKISVKEYSEPKIFTEVKNNDHKIEPIILDNMNESDTFRLLSDIKKNISVVPDMNVSENKSIPITNYYSDNKIEIGRELKDSEVKQDEKTLEIEKKISQNNIEINFGDVNIPKVNIPDVNMSEVKNIPDVNMSEVNNIPEIININKNVNNLAEIDRIEESESSIPYLKNDEEYEGVFSNINDSVSSEVSKKVNNSVNDTKKDIYFNSFNMV